MYVRGVIGMSVQKKVLVLALAVIALIIPVIMMSGAAVADKELDLTSISTRGFDNRSPGTVSVKVINELADARTVNVYVTDWNIPLDATTWGASNNNLVSASVKFVLGDESKVVNLDFRNDSVGTHHARVIVTDADGVILSQMIFSYTVDRSIWSSMWTYAAIVIVIIIVGIAFWLRMRGNPKVDTAGAYTAMEEERRVNRTTKSSKKEEYKGREERKSKKR
jgi:hypothetical protein